MIRNCDKCGKFFNEDQPGTSWAFIPDSDISYEEEYFRCQTCTKKHGQVMPMQNCSERAYGKTKQEAF